MTFTISDDIYIVITSINHWCLSVFGSEFHIEDYASSEELMRDITTNHMFFMSGVEQNQIVEYFHVFNAR